jgi:hypothetical protein
LRFSSYTPDGFTLASYISVVYPTDQLSVETTITTIIAAMDIPVRSERAIVSDESKMSETFHSWISDFQVALFHTLQLAFVSFVFLSLRDNVTSPSALIFQSIHYDNFFLIYLPLLHGSGNAPSLLLCEDR